MAPPHFDDPFLDSEGEDEQPAAKRGKKGGLRLAAATGGEARLPLQLGQHLTGDCCSLGRATLPNQPPNTLDPHSGQEETHKSRTPMANQVCYLRCSAAELVPSTRLFHKLCYSIKSSSADSMASQQQNFMCLHS